MLTSFHFFIIFIWLCCCVLASTSSISPKYYTNIDVVANASPTNKSKSSQNNEIINQNNGNESKFTTLARYFGYTELAGNGNHGESRTFGRIKKLQMGLLPVMFKLGVISTIIMFTFFLAVKGVGIGLLILMINFGFIIAKLISLKHIEWPSVSHDHHHGWQAPSWSPPQIGQDKNIHVHIHNSNIPSKWDHSDVSPYGAYSTNQNSYVEPTAGTSYESGAPYKTRRYSQQQQQSQPQPQQQPNYSIDYRDDYNSASVPIQRAQRIRSGV